MIQNGQLVEHAALSLMRVFIGFSCAFLLAAFLVTLSLLLPFFRKNEPWSSRLHSAYSAA